MEVDGARPEVVTAGEGNTRFAGAGEERTMVGKHSGNYDEHRRLHFTASGEGNRLVDIRTLKKIIVNRMKYTVK